MRVGVEVGGTFTDLVAIDGNQVQIAKVPSIPSAPDEGALSASNAAKLPMAKVDDLIHGSTVAINAILERKGASIAFLVTKGFRDLLMLQRHNRRQIYDLFYRKPIPVVSRQHTFEIDERIHGRGEKLRAPDDAEIDALAEELNALDVEAVAVSFVNAYLDNSHEAMVADRLRDLLPDVYVTAGPELTREWYEYERCCTAAANAVAGPRVNGLRFL